MRDQTDEPERTIGHRESSFVPVIPVPQTGYIFSKLIQSPQSSIQYPQKLTQCYREYLKLFRENKLLNTQLNRVLDEKAQLQQKYIQIQQDKPDHEEKKKRHRRTANQIARDYQCPNDQCDKSYGAQTSLIQHIKLKHPQFYTSNNFEEYLRSLPKKIQHKTNDS